LASFATLDRTEASRFVISDSGGIADSRFPTALLPTVSILFFHEQINRGSRRSSEARSNLLEGAAAR
jgi:hypothetical protein